MRKVLVAARETGLIERIAMVPVAVSPATLNEPMLAVNPLGQVPTLVTDEGTALYDSAVICRYLDLVLGPGILHPREPLAEIGMMRRYALGDGLSGVLMSLIAERARRQPDHSDRRIAVIGHKLQRIFAVLEAEAPALAGGAFDMGQIAVVAALAYLDFRLPDEGVWRARHPALARWFETAGARPSVAATAYFDDLAASRSSPPQQQGGPSR